MAHADIVFGNETEADEFANSNGYGVSINSKVHRIETAKKIAALPLVSSGSAPRYFHNFFLLTYRPKCFLKRCFSQSSIDTI